MNIHDTRPIGRRAIDAALGIVPAAQRTVRLPAGVVLALLGLICTLILLLAWPTAGGA